jgi:glycosyltransferase involved in cell wall biosynthesis
MDILLISRCPPYPLHFGDRLIPYHLARQLAERHHSVDLIAFYNRPEDAADIPRYERFFRHIQLIREPTRGVARYLQRLNSAEFFPQSARAAWSSAMWNAIEERLDGGNYDVVQLFGGIQVYEYRDLVRSHPNIIVPYESFTLYLKHALENSNTPSGVVGRFIAGQRYRMARAYEKRMFEGYDRLIVLTDKDAAMLREINPNLKPTVIPNGVDTDYFVPTGIEPDTPTLIFTGNFEYAPNLDAAMQLVKHIFPAVKTRVPGARLLLVGANPPLGLQAYRSGSVEITGRVPDVRPWLDQALIFISPLRMGAGIKNKVLEAMSMQKTIVATQLSMDGIAAQHEQHFLLAETNEELMRAVVRLMKDAELRQRLARNSRALIEERYTWRRVTERYEELYKEISWRRVNRN